jgi:2-(1,2-epoxy-1,2-dihydrophenyl)acetyl-CoA isomerase
MANRAHRRPGPGGRPPGRPPGRLDSAPLALRAIKENLADVEALDLATYLDRESRRHAAVRASDDAREAAQAFIDKRPPRFNGK